jgi:hypothetical protein
MARDSVSGMSVDEKTAKFESEWGQNLIILRAIMQSHVLHEHGETH